MDKKYHYLLYLWFLFIDISPHQCSRAYGLFRQRSKSITDKADATIFKPSPTPPWRGFSLVTDCQLETQVASARPFIPQGGQEGGLIRERTDPSHQCYPCPL